MANFFCYTVTKLQKYVLIYRKGEKGGDRCKR